MRRAAQAFVLAVAVGAGAPPAFAHKFHASLAEVEYNAKEKTVEVGIRLFADDLEEAIGRKRGRRVRLDVTPDVDRLVLEYLGETLTIVGRDGGPLSFTWVGMELRVDEVWVFIQASSAAGLDGATVGCRILHELFPDQVNTINVQQGDARTTLVFAAGDGERKVSF